MPCICCEIKLFSVLQLGEVAKELIRAGDAGSIKDAYHVLQGMAALTGSGKLPLPLRLQLTSAAVSVKEVSFSLSSLKATLLLCIQGGNVSEQQRGLGLGLAPLL